MDAGQEQRSFPRAMAPALALLALSVVINYIDRGNLSLAAPQIKLELRISASQLGLLLSAFFWTYTAMQFVAGPLVERFDASLVMAVGFLLWSLATAATGFVHGLVMLFAMRLLLGIGESVAFPCYSKILARHFPEQFRGFANGLIISGTYFGPALGTFVAGMLMAVYGWRPVFVGIGVLSLAWLPAWRRWMPRAPVLPAVSSSAPVSVSDIARQRSFWGASIGHFAGNYVSYFLITWLPFYLVSERGLSMTSMSNAAALIYLAVAVCALSTGWTSDFMIRRGSSATRVRKSVMAIGCALSITGLLACGFAGPHTFMVWLIVAAAGYGIEGSGTFAFSQTLAGPGAAGKWTGLQNGLANFSGVVGPALTGFVVDWTGHFFAAFAIAAAVMSVGAMGWLIVVERLEPVAWDAEPPSLAEAAGETA